MNSDNAVIVGSVGFIVLFIIGTIFFLFNKGNIDRYWTHVNEDTVTAKDQVYQTGSVRVYKFVDHDTTCYIADKQSQSTAIWCK